MNHIGLQVKIMNTEKYTSNRSTTDDIKRLLAANQHFSVPRMFHSFIRCLSPAIYPSYNVPVTINRRTDLVKRIVPTYPTIYNLSALT